VRLATIAIAVCLALPLSARADVALAVSLPDTNAVHRDFAAGVVDEAVSRFALLSPPLPPEDVTKCSTDDACLLLAAKRAGATHLLFIGVAAMGAADFVVSVRLFELENAKELASHSALAAPGRDPRAAGRKLGEQALASVTGLAPPRPPPVVEEEEPLPEPVGYTGLGPVSLIGWGVTGLATVSAAVGVGFVLNCQFQSPPEAPCDSPDTVLAIGAAAGGFAALGYGAGLGLVAVDQTLLHE
jgi:hypothetical protein